jgi:predicted amidohydrolase
VQDLTVTLLQTTLAWHDPAANRAHFGELMRRLPGPTDLVVLPEMFTTGFTMATREHAETMAGPTLGWMAGLARELGVTLCGSLIVEDAGRFYNRCVWMPPDGRHVHYDKRHLFRMAGEQQHYAAGDRRLTVEIKGWRVCPMVCYDLRFPVWSRSRGDYDLLLYVANWPARRAHAWSALLRARAIENLSYVVGVNRIGRDGNGTSYAGDSVALDFLGQSLSSEGGGDRAETAVLDMESLRSYRESFPAHLDADEFELR